MNQHVRFSVRMNVVKKSRIRVFLQQHQILRCRKTMDYDNHTTFMAILICFKGRKVCNVVKNNVLLLSLQRHLAAVKALAFHTGHTWFSLYYYTIKQRNFVFSLFFILYSQFPPACRVGKLTVSYSASPLSVIKTKNVQNSTIFDQKTAYFLFST